MASAASIPAPFPSPSKSCTPFAFPSRLTSQETIPPSKRGAGTSEIPPRPPLVTWSTAVQVEERSGLCLHGPLLFGSKRPFFIPWTSVLCFHLVKMLESFSPRNGGECLNANREVMLETGSIYEHGGSQQGDCWFGRIFSPLYQRF